MPRLRVPRAKAGVCRRYGPPEVLQLQDVDPVPEAKDVLIRIRATTVTPSDCYIRSAIPSARLAMRLMARVVIGFTRPRRPILGAVLAGEIEAIGTKVARFHVGDPVWAFTVLRFGCYAQRTCVPAAVKLLTPAPPNLSHYEAAAIPSGGLMALHFLSKANIESGHARTGGANGVSLARPLSGRTARSGRAHRPARQPHRRIATRPTA
jgi:NADPH:quinone reductase-like Zn-dependent oxidoreductase